PGEVQAQINKAITDPARIRASDIGHPEVCTVYTYHQTFNESECRDIASSCRAGTVGCVSCKKRLGTVINEMLEPMHERRIEYRNNPGRIEEILRAGTERALHIAAETMGEVREAMQISYFTL
ncbi:MAG: hypothetical protein FWG25_08630, partial [Promicromonosporaceae bacterium]|nr:hypothetical protein [Promicromonosporaceae bacterium]